VNVLDYVLIVLLLIFLGLGYRKGFIWQALSIAGIALALIVAARYHAPLADTAVLEWLRDRSDATALVVSFLAIFFVLAGITATIARAIGKKLDRTGIQPLNHWLGAFLGVLQGAALLGVLALALQQWGTEGGVVDPPQDDAQGLIAGSYLIPRLVTGTLAVADFVVELIPPEDREKIVELYRTQAPEGAAERARAGGAVDPGIDLVPRPAVAEGANPRDERRPVLDLGALRRLTLERQDEARPAPAAARTGDEDPGAER